MRKLILLIFSACLFSGQFALAQTNKKAEPVVPAAVTKAFSAKYPNMKAMDWDFDADKNAYEADFRMNGKEMEASFSPEGKWMKTKTEITKNQFPAAVNKSLSSGIYKAWTMSDFAEIETPDKGKLYKVKVRQNTQELSLKYDANGTLLEKKDSNDKKKNK